MKLDFDALYRDHAPYLRAYIVRRRRTDRDVEDIIQDTFLNAYRFREKFRGASSVRTWLTRIAINVMGNQYRVKKQRIIEQALGLEDAPVLVTQRQVDPDAAIERALTRVNAYTYRRAFRQHFLKGMKFTQMAAINGTELGTQKSASAHGARAFRRALRESFI